jgi:glycosyltransferase involved in cell wall biosynthesis
VPRISIIVPVYNTEKYLKKCLDSLVNQSLKDIEIIIINDGSTDNSQNIIDEYKNKYPKLIKSYIKENGGLSDARNFGLAKAKGEYIGFVDSDDYVDYKLFELLNNEIKKEKDIDIIRFQGYHVDNNYKIISNINSSKFDLFSGEQAFMELYKSNLMEPACFYIYRKKILDFQ